MNNVFVALLVGLLAGVGGAFTLHLLGTGSGGGSSADGEVTDLASIEERLMRIEADVQALRNPPETLSTRAAGGALGSASGGAALPTSEEAVESLLARVEERVKKTMDSKLEDLELGKDEGTGERPSRRSGRKRVGLAEAARELELTGQQEDELRRIYQDGQDKMFKLLAKPDGDPEEVKREIMEAVESRSGIGPVMQKYLPKVVGNFGEFFALQSERRSAINTALGAEKADRLRREFSIEEDDILNLQGSMRMDMRGGRR